MLAALGAVAVAVVLWDFVIGNRRRARIIEAKQQRTRATSKVRRLEVSAAHLERKIDDLRKEMAQHQATATAAKPESSERDEARKKGDQAEKACLSTEEELKALHEHMLPEAQEAASQADAALTDASKSDRPEKLRMLAVGGIPMLLVEGIVIGVAVGSLRWYQIAALLGLVVLTAAVAVAVVSMTNFGWYAACVFVGVGLLIAASAYFRTDRNPKVSPVAALDGNEPVTGFFVAETDDSIYIAQPELETAQPFELNHDAVAMTRLPKESVKFLTVGPLKGEEPAYRRSLELALAVCKRLERTRLRVAQPCQSSPIRRHPATKRTARTLPDQLPVMSKAFASCA